MGARSWPYRPLWRMAGPLMPFPASYLLLCPLLILVPIVITLSTSFPTHSPQEPVICSLCLFVKTQAQCCLRICEPSPGPSTTFGTRRLCYNSSDSSLWAIVALPIVTSARAHIQMSALRGISEISISCKLRCRDPGVAGRPFVDLSCGPQEKDPNPSKLQDWP